MRAIQINDSDHDSDSAPYATGIAERMKARASRKEPRPAEIPELRDDRDLLDLEHGEPQTPEVPATNSSRVREYVEIDADVDDLSAPHRSDPPTRSDASPAKRKKKPKRALDEYQTPRNDKSKSKRRSKKDYPVENIDSAPRSSLEAIMALQSGHIEATPDLPEPVQASMSASIKQVRNAKKPIMASVKDSQSSPIGQKERVGSSGSGQPNSTPSLDITQDNHRKSGLGVILSQASEDGDHSDLPRPRRKVIASSDEDIGSDKPASSKTMPDKEEQESVRAASKHKGTKALGKVAKAKKIAKVEKLKAEFQDPSAPAEDAQTSIVEDLPEPCIEASEVKLSPPEKPDPIESKPEQAKVINYAAIASKGLAIKLMPGPRHRVGLSKRVRVEPLHNNFVRK